MTDGFTYPTRLRTARRRRPSPRLERPDEPAAAEPRRRPAAEPGPAHGRPPPPPARPQDQGLHRPTHRRGQESPRGHPAAQALPRPSSLPAAGEPGAAAGLTGHRSVIPGTLAKPSSANPLRRASYPARRTRDATSASAHRQADPAGPRRFPPPGRPRSSHLRGENRFFPQSGREMCLGAERTRWLGTSDAPLVR
jgi:hypothetical protein